VQEISDLKVGMLTHWQNNGGQNDIHCVRLSYCSAPIVLPDFSFQILAVTIVMIGPIAKMLECRRI